MAKQDSSKWDKVKSRLMKFHLMIILVFAIVIGIVFPAPGGQLLAAVRCRESAVEDDLYKGLCFSDFPYIWTEA